MTRKLILGALRSLAFALLVSAPVRAQQPLPVVPGSATNAGNPTTPVLNAVSTAQRVLVANIGQTQHYLNYTTSSGSSRIWIRLEGCNVSCDPVTGTGWFPISQDSVTPGTGALSGNGYFPYVAVNLVAMSNGTVTASYTGTSSAPSGSAGVFNQSQPFLRVLAFNATQSTLVSYHISPPYGTSSGTLVVNFNTSGVPSGGPASLSVRVGTSLNIPGDLVDTMNVQNATNLKQTLDVPATVGDQITVGWTPNGATGGHYDLLYFFAPPGAQSGVPLCEQNAEFGIVATGPTQIIAAQNFTRIRICSLSFSAETEQQVQLVQGTGTNCATGLTTLSGDFFMPVDGSIAMSFPGVGLETIPGDNVCVEIGGTPTLMNMSMTYSQF